MKTIIISIILISCCWFTTNAQDCCDRLAQQAVKIDSLEKELLKVTDTLSVSQPNSAALQALDNIVNSYKNKQFDDLITASTKESVRRDIQLVSDNPDVRQILDDLDMYLKIKELLSHKYNDERIKEAQTRLKTVNRESTLLDKLIENIDNYSNFNQGLKETIEKINNLDMQESVAEMSDDIQKQKFNKILSNISSYVFNYDFNITDYPYLSDILLEIFKRKQPDVDADISDLLDKF
jgi:light-regulated signal transduction histidine kinase (bacteriophytochrome)